MGRFTTRSYLSGSPTGLCFFPGLALPIESGYVQMTAPRGRADRYIVVLLPSYIRSRRCTARWTRRLLHAVHDVDAPKFRAMRYQG